MRFLAFLWLLIALAIWVVGVIFIYKGVTNYLDHALYAKAACQLILGSILLGGGGLVNSAR